MFSHFYRGVSELFSAPRHRVLQGKKTKTKAVSSSSGSANLLAAKLSAANGSAKLLAVLALCYTYLLYVSLVVVISIITLLHMF